MDFQVIEALDAPGEGDGRNAEDQGTLEEVILGDAQPGPHIGQLF